MDGLKIRICFWHIEPDLAEEVRDELKKGGFEVESCLFARRKDLKSSLEQDPPDVIISEFDLPSKERRILTEEIAPHSSEVPLICLVDEHREREAAGELRQGVWDIVSKSRLYKVASSVHSSLKYARVTREMKRTEQALAESRDRYISIFSSVTDGILLFDYETREITEYNPRILEMFECTEEDMEELQIEKYSCQDEGYTMDKAIAQMKQAAGGTPVTFEWRNRTRGGKKFWTLNTFSMVHFEGRPYILLVTRDIDTRKEMGQSLRESEERLNLALHAAGLGLWDWNLMTDEVYFSPIWMSMLGYAPDELPQTFHTWTSLLHPEDRENAASRVEESIRNRDAYFEIEFRLKTKQGNYIWINSKGRAVAWDPQGNTTRLTGIHANVDDRKRDDMVRQVLFDISNAVGTTHSLDELYHKIREYLGRVVDTKNCFLALYNEESDTLTLPFMKDEMDSFTEFPARKTLTSYVIRTGEAQLVDNEREQELIRMGEIEPVGAPCISWLGVPLKHGGKTIGVFAIQSYTEEVVYTRSDAELLEFASDQIALAIDRRRHQDNIRASQERQRRVFESSPDPMIVVDQSARIQDFNSAFLEVFGVDPELSMGQKIFRFIDPRHWRQAIRDFNQTWEKGYLKNLEYGILLPGGVRFEAEVSSGAMYGPAGKPESMVLILKNISERKEAERRLIEAKSKAEESDRLKTAFLSNMSHEIRTPMNAIVGFSDLLTDEELDREERRDFIAQINQGADDLMRLIDDIIDIAKIEAGQVNMHIGECFIGDLFRELQMVYTQALKRAGKEHVPLRIQWDWPESDLGIYTDPFRIKQILVNLLSNAVKFTDDGEIVLGIEEDPDGVRFYVRDSGIGIREEKRRVIFDRFMQGHDNKTRIYGGTGLGLAISKNLTELLGGEIGVSSSSGNGSTFWFILPRNEVPLKYEAKLKTPQPNARSWKNKKVLIAEDDHSNYYFLLEAVRETGIEVLWSKDGEETLEMVRENPDLDLILMDINMPLKNGYECTRIIKEERPDLPVIAQTAYAMSGEREISREAGCDDYLAKPIKVTDLLNAMSRFI